MDDRGYKSSTRIVTPFTDRFLAGQVIAGKAPWPEDGDTD